MLKSGGKRRGFVRDRHGNPVDQRTATIEQLLESGTCFDVRINEELAVGQITRARIWGGMYW
jgi:hypothetical protein